MDSTRFDEYVIAVADKKRLAFRSECMAASIALDNGAVGDLANKWTCSKQRIKTLARIWLGFDWQDIVPTVPEPLYKAAIEAAEATGRTPIQWLEQALAEKWCARQLRDAADILKGKHLSGCVFSGDVEVTTWEVDSGTVTVEGLSISGERPPLARVSVREVLQKG